MVLIQKWPFFQLFFLGNISQGSVFYDILERKNGFLGYKNKQFKRSKNWLFFEGVNRWFWSQNSHFSNFFFLLNIGQENVFFDFLERKNCFLGYKKKFKQSKNCHFFKWVNPWFWSKTWPFFQLFFLGIMSQGNVFYDILQEKNAFLSYKNKKFKKSKNCHFSKWVNPWFWSKNDHFSNFFF